MAAPGGQGEVVLVVDDEDAVVSTVHEVLRSHGYRVRTATNGEEALAALEDADPPIDLVVTDLMMPGMDGCQLAIELQRRHPGLPVLFMSGYADRAIFGDQRLDESQHFLRKPFTAESLTFAVRAAIHAGIPPYGALSPESR